MAAGYSDLFLNQGETFNTELTLNDPNGLPYNLTGFNIYSQARTSYYTANASIIFTSSVTDANNGVIQLSANASSTILPNITTSKLVYDVFIMQTSTGVVTKVLEGQVFLSPAATIIPH